MIKVSLVGTGNVSHILKSAMDAAQGIDVLEVYNRGNLPHMESEGTIGKSQPDIYIIAVNDDAIPFVSQQFKETKKMVVHTSGNVSIEALPKNVRRGVFYPLQTISKSCTIDFKEVPLCLEAENEDDLEVLRNLALLISDHVYQVPSEKRKQMHLAAVFANNFTNHMYHVGSEICRANDIPFAILHPLIQETARKVVDMPPKEAQTGPAIRHDSKTMEEHLSLLKNEKYRALYTLLSESIQDTYGKEL